MTSTVAPGALGCSSSPALAGSLGLWRAYFSGLPVGRYLS